MIIDTLFMREIYCHYFGPISDTTFGPKSEKKANIPYKQPRLM